MSSETKNKPQAKPSEAQIEFMQDIGLFMEKSGLTPVAGQLVGWLMVCEPPHQSANQLKAILQVAKSTISVTTRQLIAIGFLEKIRLHGDRTDYYRYNQAFIENSMKKRSEGLQPFVDFYKKALELNDPQSDRGKLFQMLIEMSEFFIKEYEEIGKKWEKYQKEKWG